MKKLVIINLVLIQAIAYGQPFSPRQQEVITAENCFAALSKSSSQVEAFMAYLSDSTIMFKGAEPVLGKTLYKNRKPDSSLLFWWPVFIGVSYDGSMGFSTGPWEWSKRRDTLPQAFGYYATLWRKDKEGQWKMGVDLGIGFPASERSNPPLMASPNIRPGDKRAPQDAHTQLEVDRSYNALLKKSSYIRERFTSDGHMLRSDHKPFATPAEFNALDETGKSFSFTQAGGGVSSNIMYGYGTVKISGSDGKTLDGKYLRVWKTEQGVPKIVLDVLSN